MLHISKICKVFTIIFSDTQDTFLELQSAATNLEPWDSFVHFSKLGMVDKYQLLWLKQKGTNKILNNAFEQANKKSFQDLMAFSKKFKEENFEWMFLEEDFDKISNFIISYPDTMKVTIKEEKLPDGALQVFQIHTGIY